MSLSPSRLSRDAPAGGFTPLERTVLAALAEDLAREVPDLARQAAAARPTLRRNTGFGLYTELSSDAAWPVDTSGVTGDLGSVHVVFPALADPVAFSARLVRGRLIGLMGDSYGQDTRALDLTALAFDQVFTVDAAGRSISFDGFQPRREHTASDHRAEPRGPAQFAPVRRAVEAEVPPADPAPVPLPLGRLTPLRDAPPPVHVGALQRLQAEAADRAAAFDQGLAKAAPSERPPPEGPERVKLLFGVWAAIALIALLSVLILDVPWIFALVAAVWLGRIVRKPAVLARIRQAVETWQASRAARG